MGKILKILGIGTLGFVGIAILVVLLFVIGTAFTAFFVALIWNWIGLHTLFGLGALKFWEVVGIAAALNLLSGLFRSNVQTGS